MSDQWAVPSAEAHTLPVSDIRPGDLIYLGALVPFTVAWVGEGWGRTWILRGRIPPDDPHHGAGSELTIELERDHRMVVHRAVST